MRESWNRFLLLIFWTILWTFHMRAQGLLQYAFRVFLRFVRIVVSSDLFMKLTKNLKSNDSWVFTCSILEGLKQHTYIKAFENLSMDHDRFRIEMWVAVVLRKFHDEDWTMYLRNYVSQTIQLDRICAIEYGDTFTKMEEKWKIGELKVWCTYNFFQVPLSIV